MLAFPPQSSERYSHKLCQNPKTELEGCPASGLYATTLQGRELCMTPVDGRNAMKGVYTKKCDTYAATFKNVCVLVSLWHISILEDLPRMDPDPLAHSGWQSQAKLGV